MTRARHLAILTMALLMLTLTTPAFAAYTAWDPGAANGTSLPTPHKDYQVTTVKCAVCHAVHQAPVADATGTVPVDWTADSSPEMLLRSSVANSCTYCHITTSIGAIQIYGGDPDLYLNDDIFGHQAPNATCVGCHSVHGANTYDGVLSSKILKRLPIQQTFVDFITNASSGTGDPEVIYTINQEWGGYPLPPNDWLDWDGRYVQQTAFCTGCHPYYSPASEDTVTVSSMWNGSAFSTATVSFKTHPMKRNWEEPSTPGTWGYGFVAQGSTLPTSTEVAWMSTDGCRRCHSDEQWTNQGPGTWDSDFPHRTPGQARFLVSAEAQGVGYTNIYDPSDDGACLVCHRWEGAWDPNNTSGVPTMGVGFTY